MAYNRPTGFIIEEYDLRFQMRPVRPRPGGNWLGYLVGIAALTEFGGLVSEWGAIEIPIFTIVCGIEDKAVLEVHFLQETDQTE